MTIQALPDHLFISYAWEDGALCEWLYRKLTAAGYRVWCDRFSLRGGDRWPRDIDRAIKTRTFRMIALLSRHSIAKENPSKERQLALALSKERQEQFLIPLNVDGLRTTELGWELSDLQYIPFQNWAAGLARLLATLEAIGAPRPLQEEGPRLAAETFLPPSVLQEADEIVYTNCLEVRPVPEVLHRLALTRPLLPTEEAALEQRWAFHKVNPRRVLAFGPPPADGGLERDPAQDTSARWRTVSVVDGLRPADVVSSLIRKALGARARQLGMAVSEDGETFYFPKGLLPKDKLFYPGYQGRRTWVAVVGERRAGAVRTRYHLGVRFRIRRDVIDGFVAQFKLRLHLVDLAGEQLDAAAINRRRKQITKAWWNHEWLGRQFAVLHFLRGDADEIVIDNEPGEQIRVSGRFLTGTVPAGIKDAALEPVRTEVLEALERPGRPEDSEEAEDLDQADT